MCRWEVGIYDSGQQYENDCIICSSPSWWYFDETLEDAAEIENEEKSEQELSLESIDFGISTETLEDAAEIENEEKSEQELSLESIDFSPSWWYFDETLEDAAERLRMKRKVNKNLA
ncbi:hypothetical protein EVAR_70636_1 [Eumeta japonica]|uniref:Uncharacterized protein n=1 Tax=Eumeta variegata TaxID=151549 RepID=A0A4C2A9K7_EUMVA|nr:hypothetical protein EVAR_70636_1 [Eumeta japonica]